MKLSKAYSARGADMGRVATLPIDSKVNVKLHLIRVRLDSGGYDNGGAYWGLGEPLYLTYSDEEYPSKVGAYPMGRSERVWYFLRASNRNEAKELVRAELPNAKFYR